MKPRIPVKQVGETLNLTTDFKGYLRVGLVNGSGVTFTETIASAATTITVYSGTDANPSAMVSGAATISGTKVTQTLIGGVSGTVYTITTTIGTTVQSPYQPQSLTLKSFIVIQPTAP
jgi:hypothetical protein